MDSLCEKSRAESDADLGDAADVRMSHETSLAFILYHQQHTRDM